MSTLYKSEITEKEAGIKAERERIFRILAAKGCKSPSEILDLLEITDEGERERLLALVK